jgi:hypothetical protein
LTTAPRIKPTSIFLRSARRPNPGRRSTYRRGIIVQTTGTGSAHSVTIHPNGPREGFEIEVKGKLAALIGGSAFPQAVYSGGYMVAGEGLEPPTPGL